MKTCEKCGYSSRKLKEQNKIFLCSICSKFAPKEKELFQEYILEKVDWRVLDTFRKQTTLNSQKEGMFEQAKKGNHISRPPLGYSLVKGKLIQNEEASRVHSLFKTFLEEETSLNNLSKRFSISINGIKKILSNRTYLGEIKFDGRLNKSSNTPLISQELFYAVQRKLEKKN